MLDNFVIRSFILRFLISINTKPIAASDEIMSRIGMRRIWLSSLIKKNVRTVEIVFMRIKRIVMTCIISSPRKRKSMRNTDRNTTEYESMTNRIFALRIGKHRQRMPVTTKPKSPRMMRAIRVSPEIVPIFLLSPLQFTMSFVADRTNPKSTKICM